MALGRARVRTGARPQRGVDLALPWKALPEEFRHCVLHGTGDEPVEATIDMPNKNETARMTYTSNQPLRGAFAEVRRVFTNARTPAAKERYLPYLREQLCPTCEGSGFERRHAACNSAEGRIPACSRRGSGGADLGRAPEERTRSRAARRG